MKLTYLQSSTVIVEHDGVKVLCDPWLVDGEYYGAWAARIELDLMLANENLENYHKLSQSYALCQVGRDFTLILESL